MNIFISKDQLNKLNMEASKRPVTWTPSSQYYDKPAGDEFYRLISFIAQNMPDGSSLVDIGTYFGLSAVALASNPKCTVKTYDIYDHITEDSTAFTVKNLENVEYCLKDCMDDGDVLAAAKVIILDVDPHDGAQETDIMAKLRAVGFKGIVILDDINLNEKMKAFWSEIPERKLDITSYGHWSGTGIVYFSDEIRVDFV
jgi:predicted O-methyltransferase YrrM